MARLSIQGLLYYDTTLIFCMAMFKKILFAFDGSSASLKASKYAIHLSSLENSDLIFLHVIEHIKQGGVIGLRAKYGDA